MTRPGIIKELRTWIGTPWRHQGRTKGVGCDCLGVVVAAARAVGPLPTDIPRGYHRLPYKNLLQETLDRFLDRVEPEDIRIADVVLMTQRGHTMGAHTGVLTPWRHEGEGAPFGILHAMLETRAVSEHAFDPARMHVVGYYRFRDLT
jgi:cell wall-associated NlpC family hydrolase